MRLRPLPRLLEQALSGSFGYSASWLQSFSAIHEFATGVWRLVQTSRMPQ